MLRWVWVCFLPVVILLTSSLVKKVFNVALKRRICIPVDSVPVKIAQAFTLEKGSCVSLNTPMPVLTISAEYTFFDNLSHSNLSYDLLIWYSDTRFNTRFGIMVFSVDVSNNGFVE